jgi:hypothetical protein
MRRRELRISSESFAGDTEKTAVSQYAVTNKQRDVLTKQAKTMTAEQRSQYAATWTWGEMKCSKGHPIANPQKKQDGSV